MAEKTTKPSAKNITKGESGDNHELNLNPLKGTIKDDNYKDHNSSKNRLTGTDKEILENQVQSATDNSNKRVADKIQNS